MPPGRGSDINQRTAYTMYILDHGHSCIEMFTSLMNMPKPMTRMNCDKSIMKIGSVTKYKNRYFVRLSHVVDTGVAYEGTWQRGFSSLNGVFTAISIDSGKAFDVEPMSRSCKSCFLRREIRISVNIIT